jgi:hypothetical protein
VGIPAKPAAPGTASLSFRPASSLEDTVKLRALLMGPAGAGKTSVAVLTAPRPVGVILCETDSALDYPRVHMREVEGLNAKEIDKQLKFMKVSSWETMQQALAASRAAADAGDIKSLVVDPFNFFTDNLMDQCFKWTQTQDGKEDGRRAHPEATKRIRQIVNQLMNVDCHVVVVSHYMDVGDAAKKGGPDKVPMLPNKEARVIVHGMFPHKLWMEMRNGKRVFVMTPQGFTGPGVRGFRGAKEIPADIGTLMNALHLPDAPKGAAAVPDADAEEEETEEGGETTPAAQAPAGAAQNGHGHGRPAIPGRPSAPPPRPAPAARPSLKTSPSRPLTSPSRSSLNSRSSQPQRSR